MLRFGALLNLMHQDIVRILGEGNTQQVSNWERGIILPTRRRVDCVKSSRIVSENHGNY